MSLLRYQHPTFGAWPTFNRLANLSQQLESLFERTVARQSAVAGFGAPALDLFENTDAYVATVELPGLSAADVNVAFHESVLTISGERKAPTTETPGQTVRGERPAGKFSRSFEVPGRVDSAKVSAAFKDGVLTVTLPKAEEAKPRRIDVALN